MQERYSYTPYTWRRRPYHRITTIDLIRTLKQNELEHTADQEEEKNTEKTMTQTKEITSQTKTKRTNRPKTRIRRITRNPYITVGGRYRLHKHMEETPPYTEKEPIEENNPAHSERKTIIPITRPSSTEKNEEQKQEEIKEQPPSTSKDIDFLFKQKQKKQTDQKTETNYYATQVGNRGFAHGVPEDLKEWEKMSKEEAEEDKKEYVTQVGNKKFVHGAPDMVLDWSRTAVEVKQAEEQAKKEREKQGAMNNAILSQTSRYAVFEQHLENEKMSRLGEKMSNVSEREASGEAQEEAIHEKLEEWKEKSEKLYPNTKIYMETLPEKAENTVELMSDLASFQFSRSLEEGGHKLPALATGIVEGAVNILNPMFYVNLHKTVKQMQEQDKEKYLETVKEARQKIQEVIENTNDPVMKAYLRNTLDKLNNNPDYLTELVKTMATSVKEGLETTPYATIGALLGGIIGAKAIEGAVGVKPVETELVKTMEKGGGKLKLTIKPKDIATETSSTGEKTIKVNYEVTKAEHIPEETSAKITEATAKGEITPAEEGMVEVTTETLKNAFGETLEKTMKTTTLDEASGKILQNIMKLTLENPDELTRLIEEGKLPTEQIKVQRIMRELELDKILNNENTPPGLIKEITEIAEKLRDNTITEGEAKLEIKGALNKYRLQQQGKILKIEDISKQTIPEQKTTITQETSKTLKQELQTLTKTPQQEYFYMKTQELLENLENTINKKLENLLDDILKQDPDYDKLIHEQTKINKLKNTMQKRMQRITINLQTLLEEAFKKGKLNKNLIKQIEKDIKRLGGDTSILDELRELEPYLKTGEETTRITEALQTILDELPEKIMKKQIEKRITELKKQITKQETETEKIKPKIQETTRKIQELQKTIQDTRAQTDKILEKLLNELEEQGDFNKETLNDLNRLNRKIRLLRKQLEMLKQEKPEYPELSELYRELSELERKYKLIQDSMKNKEAEAILKQLKEKQGEIQYELETKLKNKMETTDELDLLKQYLEQEKTETTAETTKETTMKTTTETENTVSGGTTTDLLEKQIGRMGETAEITIEIPKQIEKGLNWKGILTNIKEAVTPTAITMKTPVQEENIEPTIQPLTPLDLILGKEKTNIKPIETQTQPQVTTPMENTALSTTQITKLAQDQAMKQALELIDQTLPVIQLEQTPKTTTIPKQTTIQIPIPIIIPDTGTQEKTITPINTQTLPDMTPQEQPETEPIETPIQGQEEKQQSTEKPYYTATQREVMIPEEPEEYSYDEYLLNEKPVSRRTGKKQERETEKEITKQEESTQKENLLI